MADVVGYRLEKDGAVIQSWGGIWGQCPGIPNPLFLPNGDHVHGASPDVDYNGYIIRPWLMDKPPEQTIKAVEGVDVSGLQSQIATQAAQLAQLQNALAELVALARAP